MPKKPIKPDRVRTPTKWWRARLTNIGSGFFLAAVIIVGVVMGRAGYSFWLVLPIVLFIVLVGYSLAVRYEFSVHRVWIDRIIEHDGRMCPQCAYPLSGIQSEHISITCPECGYLTKDAARLFERWHNSVKSFYLQDDKRLRSHRNKEPGD